MDRVHRVLAKLCPLFSSLVLLSCSSGGGGSAADAAASAALVAGAMTPNSGPVGALVSIQGANFALEIAQLEVRFGAAQASVEVATANNLIVRVPLGAVSGPVSIVSAGRAVKTPGSFLVLPAVLGATPGAGRVGDVITVAGTGFVAEAPSKNEILFAGLGAQVPAPVTGSTATDLFTQIPPGATSGKLSVRTPAGNSESSFVFQVIPSITGFSPVSGIPGDVVTIGGFNFRPAIAENQVSFGGAQALVLEASYDLLRVEVPAGAVTASIQVTTPEGNASSAQSFAVLLPPAIVSFSPTLGPAGAVVTILGSNFVPGASTVSFNDVPAVVNGVTPSQIVALVPENAGTGPIRVSTPNGTAQSANSFQFLLLPAVTQAFPLTGSPGTLVRIVGENFTAASVVSFNGVAGNVFSANANEIVAEVPAGASSGPLIVSTIAGSSPAGNFTVLHPRYLFVSNADHTISAMGFSKTGEPRHRSFAFAGAGAAPKAMETSPGGAFLFAALGGSNTVASFAIGAAGSLTPVNAAPAGAGTADLLANAAGTRLYAANAGSSSMTVFSIAGDGTLAPIQEKPSAAGTNGLVLSPDGAFCFAASGDAGVISSFSVDAGGLLTDIEEEPAGVGTRALALVPGKNLLLALSPGSQEIRSFAIAGDGTLSPASSAATGNGAVDLVVDPTGVFAFVANGSDETIARYQIGAGGALNFLGSVNTGGSGLKDLHLDLAGNLYALHGALGEIRAFKVSSLDGAVTAGGIVRTRSNPQAMAQSLLAVPPASAAAKAVYLVNAGITANTVAALPVSVTGTLSNLPGSPVAAGIGPNASAVDPLGKFLFVADLLPSAAKREYVSSYLVQANGLPLVNGNVQTTLADKKASALEVDRSGRFLLVAVQSKSQIESFAIPSNGVLAQTPINGVATGLSASHLVVDPTGRFAYVSNFSSPIGSISGFGLDAQTGTLSALPGTSYGAIGAGLNNLCVHPNGRWVYAVYGILTNAVGFFSINADGSLAQVQNGALGGTPTWATLDPDGRFLYMGRSTGTLTVHAIQADGSVKLAPEQTVTVGGTPSGLVFDPTGAYLFVSNQVAGSALSFAVAANGTLSANGSILGFSSPKGLTVLSSGQ